MSTRNRASSYLRAASMASLASLVILLACDGESITQGGTGDSVPTPENSEVTASPSVVQVGGTSTVTLRVRDQYGDDLAAAGLDVTFTASGGTTLGVLSPVVDHGDGTYSATFTGTSAGSPTAMGALLEGEPVGGTASLQVILPPPPDVSLSLSVVTVASDSIDVGGTTAVTLRVRDVTGADVASGGLSVAFMRSGGTSQGSFSAVTDNGNGTYGATFTGTSAGTPTSIRATINGSAVTSAPPTVQVHAQPSSGGASPAHSLVSVSTGAVQVGGTATVMLRARDAQGSDLTSGGLTVTFGTLGGSSAGTFGGVTDNGNGTYQATFTGTHAGSPATVTASIDGAPVTTQLPTIQVLAPPPGGVVCEAIAPAQCMYVAADAGSGGTGSFASPFRRPQDAIAQAGPGDFIYLRGGAEFTHAHASGDWIINTVGVNGAPGQLITIKSYPGEQAVVRGQSSGGVPTENLSVRVASSYWRIEGLRLIHSQMCIACQFVSGVQHVWVVGNHISDAIASAGNWGMVTIHADQLEDPGHPRNIFIHDNIIHTMWGFAHDGSGPYPWYDEPDTEHHTCLLLQNASGLVEIIGNEIYECPAAVYGKYVGHGPTTVRDNYIHNSQRITGAWRAENTTFENNVFARFTRTSGGFRLQFGNGITWVNNTFDFAPWSGNQAGSDGVISWNDTDGHSFRRNVILGAQYHNDVPGNFGSFDIDENCAVWSGSFVAAPGHSWSSYQSAFGHDQNGVRVQLTSSDAVFANPLAGDYRLIGAAASACAGVGADLVAD